MKSRPILRYILVLVILVFWPNGNAPADEHIFVDLPAQEFVILNTSGAHNEISARLVVQAESEAAVEVIHENQAELTRVVSKRLEAVRTTDLRGASELFALRDDLLAMARRLVPPSTISDILFEELAIE